MPDMTGLFGESLPATNETPMSAAAAQLRSFIERIERLETEKQEIADDIKEVYSEAKGTGFDTKAIKAMVALRKMDQAQRQEERSILELYAAALGVVI